MEASHIVALPRDRHDHDPSLEMLGTAEVIQRLIEEKEWNGMKSSPNEI